MMTWEHLITLAAGVLLGLLAPPLWRRLGALGRRPRHLRRRGVRRRAAVAGEAAKPVTDHTLANEDNQ